MNLACAPAAGPDREAFLEFDRIIRFYWLRAFPTNAACPVHKPVKIPPERQYTEALRAANLAPCNFGLVASNLTAGISMEQMTSLLAQYGLLIVFGNVLLTQAGLPLPALPMLIVSGALVHNGQLALVPVVLAAVAGSLIGDLPWYMAGRMAGYRVLRVLCRVSIEPDSCVKQTETTFERWGAPSLLIAKFVPGFATVAPPISGAMRLGLPTFLLYSALGAALWAGVAVALGMVFHTQIDWLLQWLSEKGKLAVLILGLVVGLYMAVKWVERRMFIRIMRMARITVDELKALLKGDEPVIILDARSTTARKIDPRHIPGAIAVDITAPEHKVAGVTPGHHVVVYCS
jgi:membrane protein DedA with SNARE-associated domain